MNFLKGKSKIYRKFFSIGGFAPLEEAASFFRFISNKIFGGVSRFVKIVAKHPLSLTGFAAALLFLSAPEITHAGWKDDFAASAIAMIMGMVGYLLGLIAGAIFWLIGLLASLALTLNSVIVSSPVVVAGWEIILNITNLGFVLAIIVIAFATILNIEKYAIKKTLMKLIAAALIVNFSLVIGGAIINVSNSATQFMMEKSGADSPTAWAAAFSNMFKVQRLLQVSEGVNGTDMNTLKGTTEGSLSAFFTIIASLVFAALFTAIAAITFAAVVILFFIRYVYLSILLIFSPIIWLCWIFPYSQKYWSDWWEKFLKWSFFAPVTMFFIYLAMRTMSVMDPAVQSTAADAAFRNAPFTTPLDVIGQMVVVTGLIMGGLMAANKIADEGMKGVLKVADGAVNGAMKGTKGYVANKGKAALQHPFAVPSQRMWNWAGDPGASPLAAARRAIGKFNIKRANLVGVAGQKMNRSNVPGMKKLGKAMTSFGSSYKKPKGFMGSLWSGIVSGSGLIKKKGGPDEWACQVCGDVKKSTKKPTGACSNGHAAAAANWTKI